MDAEQQNVARACMAAAYDGSLDFPSIVGALAKAGFEGYTVDYRRAAHIYYLPDGDSIEITTPQSSGAVAARFDAAAVKAAIGEAQANAPGYSYRGFCEKVKAAGCAGYIVSFLGRRVLYFGRAAETHVEFFPDD